MSTLVWDEKENAFKKVDSEVVVSQLDDDFFLNVKEDGVYTIVRMTSTLDGEFIVIFEANGEKLKADAEAGVVKLKERGEGEDSSVFNLDITKRELDEYVADNIDELFSKSSVGVITPVVKPPKREEAKPDQ